MINNSGKEGSCFVYFFDANIWGSVNITSQKRIFINILFVKTVVNLDERCR